MIQRAARSLIFLSLLGCGGVTDPDEGTTITTQFTTQFVETSVHQGGVTQNCSDTYTLAGTLTFVVRSATGSTLDGEGRLNATQTHVSTSGNGCSPGPNRSSGGDWTADLGGTPSQATFEVQRTGSGSFPYVTRFSFAGTVSADAASGTLTFTQTAQGITGTSTQSSSNAQATVVVSLH